MFWQDRPEVQWRKSSRSGSDNNCVEAASLNHARVAVRDSKNPSGSVLAVSSRAWRAFIARVT